jgi:hypothetical protein
MMIGRADAMQVVRLQKAMTASGWGLGREKTPLLNIDCGGAPCTHARTSSETGAFCRRSAAGCVRSEGERESRPSVNGRADGGAQCLARQARYSRSLGSRTARTWHPRSKSWLSSCPTRSRRLPSRLAIRAAHLCYGPARLHHCRRKCDDAMNAAAPCRFLSERVR